MAARVTKLFLQNCAPAPRKDSAASLSKRSKRRSSESKATPPAKNARRKVRQMSAKISGKKNKAAERVLDVARRELQQADRTQENLRKLKNKTSAKSQRMMAKALEQRAAAFR